jgi:outer membrane receptor protein involved in Fe transport
MKKYVLGIALLGLGFGLQAQDLYVKFSSGTDVRYGLTTVERITFSATDMRVEMGAGNIASYGLDSIAYFNYKASIVSGVAAKELQGEALKLYPNPTTGNLNLDYALEKGGKVALSIYNATGQKVYTTTREQGIGQQQQSLDLKAVGLTQGVYFVELRTASTQFINKVILD